MGKRVLLRIAYDGTAYCGWQIQIKGITVEEIINRELSNLLGEEIAVIGASRTDSGVHANMFCFHSDIDCNIPIDRFPAALNAHLPDDIAVIACQRVPDDEP